MPASIVRQREPGVIVYTEGYPNAAVLQLLQLLQPGIDSGPKLHHALLVGVGEFDQLLGERIELALLLQTQLTDVGHGGLSHFFEPYFRVLKHTHP